jgi:hypothetical protein
MLEVLPFLHLGRFHTPLSLYLVFSVFPLHKISNKVESISIGVWMLKILYISFQLFLPFSKWKVRFILYIKAPRIAWGLEKNTVIHYGYWCALCYHTVLKELPLWSELRYTSPSLRDLVISMPEFFAYALLLGYPLLLKLLVLLRHTFLYIV